MDIQTLEQNTVILEQANIAIEKLNNIGKICLLFNQGASADSCMERIKQIILE